MLASAFLFITYFAQVVAQTEFPRQECLVGRPDRIDCGHVGISHDQCVSRGCCWLPCIAKTCNPTHPRCFLSSDLMTERCTVPRDSKEDCGYSGIQQTECNTRGCCWAPTSQTGVPWCFRSKAVSATTDIPTTPPTPEPGNEGEVRLADGDTVSGRVEIYHDGRWGTVCDDNFDTDAVNTVCRQLGFFDGVYVDQSHYGPGSGPIWMDNFECSIFDIALTQCRMNSPWGTHDCSHFEDAGVKCSGTLGSSVEKRSADSNIELFYCPGYKDKDGVWHNGLACPQWGGPEEKYCCGTDGQRYCCPQPEEISEDSIEQ